MLGYESTREGRKEKKRRKKPASSGYRFEVHRGGKKLGRGKAINPCFDRVKAMVNYLEGHSDAGAVRHRFARLYFCTSAPLSRRLKGETLSRGGGQPSSTRWKENPEKLHSSSRDFFLLLLLSWKRTETKKMDGNSKRRITKRIDGGNDYERSLFEQNRWIFEIARAERNREDLPRNCFSSVRPRRLN